MRWEEELPPTEEEPTTKTYNSEDSKYDLKAQPLAQYPATEY